MNLLPPSLKKAAVQFCKDRFAVPLVSRHIARPHHGSPVSLHMVVGKKMSLLGMLCLRSLERHTEVSWAPFIHDDGTLDDEDVARWKRHFPDCTVISKPLADEVVGDALKPYPKCRENRLKHHWFLKVFDTHHYAPNDHYIVMDSDILFFNRPQLLLDWIANPDGFFHVMRDTSEKYSHPRKMIEGVMDVRMMTAVNSGLDLVPKEQFPLATIERFLDGCAGNAVHYEFLEQTIFALMVSLSPKGKQFPKEYEISWNRIRKRGAICRHYVGMVKEDLFFLEGATSCYLNSLIQRSPQKTTL